MRLPSIWLLTLFGLLAASSVIFGRSDASKRAIAQYSEHDVEFVELAKRKGGGGGGKGGSSGGGKTGSSGSSSSGSSASSSRGGTSPGGSGATRGYGGGSYYGGGAAVPYTAGGRTARGLAPVGLLGVGALGFFGGAWLAGAYLYHFNNPYRFYNASSRMNETKPVNCLCQEYNPCGCDDNNDPNFYNSVIGDGDPNKLNSSLVRVANVNGTDQIFLNGTLPNGTTADGPDSSAAAGGIYVNPMVGFVALAIAMASAFCSM